MEPVTLVLGVAILVGTAAGFGAGWGLKPDSTAEALEQQTAALEAVQQGNLQLVAEVQAVALQEAERELTITERLTDVPPQCVPELGGDPMGLPCAWAWCVRTGETDAQRCEQGKLLDQLVARFAEEAACPDVLPAP